MMVVIAIILTLASISFFPYTYYMQRASVERSIRNGKMYDEQSTANKLLVFRVGSDSVEQYLYTGAVVPETATLSSNPSIIQDKNIEFDSNVEILSFSGVGVGESDVLVYSISAPYAVGVFSTGSTTFSSTGVFVTLGYDGASQDSGRARQILLRPYLQ
jgi:type II secretory pathway pseudopilin PulG